MGVIRKQWGGEDMSIKTALVPIESLINLLKSLSEEAKEEIFEKNIRSKKSVFLVLM